MFKGPGLAGLLFAFANVAVQAQAPAEVHQSFSAAVPAGQYAGVVYDLKDGKPVAGALVSIVGTRSSAVADLNGQFRITMPQLSDSIRVQVRALGFFIAETPVLRAEKDGVAMSVGLAQSPIEPCPEGFVNAKPKDMTVYVRDIITLHSPRTEVSIQTSDSLGSRHPVKIQPDSTASVVAAKVGSGFGDTAFSVTVTAEGYEPWTRRNIVRDMCRAPIPADLYVWLTPKR